MRVRSSWHSYPKVWALGHRNVLDIFKGTSHVVIQEKYDGSQFSFGVHGGNLHTRSRGQEFDPYDPPKLFRNAVEYVMQIQGALRDGYTYRGEAICTRRHNTLEYARTPKGFVVLYDVELQDGLFMAQDLVKEEAKTLGLEYALTWSKPPGAPPSMEDLKDWLKEESTLGGVPVEGVVFKNYNKYTQFDHVMMAKFVSEEFKEKHQKNPSFKKGREFVKILGEQYRTEARWNKAVHHLAEQGFLEQDPKDIGILMKELNVDFEEECAEEVKEALWKHYRKDVIRQVTRGFPEWYKEQLAARVLE